MSLRSASFSTVWVAAAAVLAFAASAVPVHSGESKTGREIKGKVVSADSEAKTITLKEEAAEGTAETERTLAVDEKALASLKDVKAGDKVVVKCKEGESDAASPDAAKPEGGTGAEPAPTPCVVEGIESPEAARQ